MIEQPLTIYFDLSPGKRPTLGAVGAAMVQFEKMAGEAVFLLEPNVEFSLVYRYSAPGSLRIIASLRGLVTKQRLEWLAIIIATTLLNNGVSYLQEKAMDEAVRAVAGEQAATLTDEDIARIVEAVRKAERSETVTAPRREFYRAVEPDQAITGVGVAPNEHEARPNIVVPRSEFGDRSASASEKADDAKPVSRVLSERIEVVLANAPLIETKAKWRIFANGHQVSVNMLDERFRQQVLDGTTQLRLAGGVILVVTLETTQVFDNGVWQNKSYVIPKVHTWRQDPKQAQLLFSHGRDDDDQDDQSDQ